MTRSKTSMGATAFRADTNNDPKMAMPAALGTDRAKITPSIIPAKIRFTRLILFHLSMIVFMIIPPDTHDENRL
ncbi:hypothetical protein D3C77_645880 [compost metagenome]